MTPSEEKRIDTAIANYQCAQAELIQRIRLRDHVLLIYMSAVGVLLGIALKDTSYKQILLAVPLITLGVSILISQHNYLISLLGVFSSNEIGEFLKNITPDRADAVQWHNSKTLKDYYAKSTKLRSFGHGILILTPSLIALLINVEQFHMIVIRVVSKYATLNDGSVSAYQNASLLYEVMWVGGVLFTIVSFVVIHQVHIARIEHYNTRNWYS